MHKLFLSQPECSIIRGADKIINIIGGFPSMEDGQLIEINAFRNSDTSRSTVFLLFDISGWKTAGRSYSSLGKIKGFSQTKIGITFKNCCEVYLADPFETTGEIKFGNTPDRKQMRQVDFPEATPVIDRPFCVFYIRDRFHVIIDFDEKECEISAELFD